MITIFLTMFAHAEEPISEQDRGAKAVYKVGVITGAIGAGVEVAGTTVLAIQSANNQDLSVPVALATNMGALGEAVGAPIMLGSSLRSRRRINQAGGQVGSGAGATGWFLWSSSLGLLGARGFVSDPDVVLGLTVAGVGTRLGSYVAAVAQQSANDRGRTQVRSSGWSDGPPPIRVAVSPWTPEGRGMGARITVTGL